MALLEGNKLKQVCQLNSEIEDKTIHMVEELKLSARALHKILKVARTIADLEESKNIIQAHINEAITYRQFDRLLKNR